MHLVKILTAESQKNISIYDLLVSFYILLEKDDWIKNYIFWELELFRILGYHLEFNNLVNKRLIQEQLQYVSKSLNEKKIVPNFLIDKELNNVDKKNLLSGLKIVGDYLDKTILKPNNLTQPISRLQFINTLK